MKQFWAFVKKEWYHISRDYRTLLVLIGMPIVQILIFGYALSNEVKNTRIAILDFAGDSYSTELSDKIEASRYFETITYLRSINDIDRSLRSGEVKMVVIFPNNFTQQLEHQHASQLQLITDGSNPNLSATLINYINAITRDFQTHDINELSLPYTINVQTRMMYNPQLLGAFTFVPGVIALVLMLICTMMTSVSIVKEKELGNMEILLVSPMHPLAVVFSKAVPYIGLSIGILSITLLLSVFLLGVPISGSIILLYLVSLVFIISALALGLLISTITNSQQVAMMISLMGLMLPTMMFSGFMFPIESMPLPLQWISNVVPAKWYFYSIQSIMIKGLGIDAILQEFLILSAFAIFFLILSVRNFKVRMA